MTAFVDHKIFTRRDYHRMIEAGVLTEDDRVELINGNIITMSPVGSRHLATVNRFIRPFTKIVSDDYILSIQNPVGINDISEPEPDVAILHFREDFYETKKPTPQDVPLIIEVSDTTLEKDRKVKLPLYANAGIPEAWIVDLTKNIISVCKNPSPKGYQNTKDYFPNENITVSAIPNLTVPVSDIFGL